MAAAEDLENKASEGADTRIIYTRCICLKNVKLEADSWQVVLGENITMYCQYDLQGGKLLSVKWYRGNHEFCRYDPQRTHPLKIFPFPIPFSNITIDLTKSSQNQVTLLNVSIEFDGSVACEVTVENTYNSVTSKNKITVVSPPKGEPVIKIQKDKYAVNDTLIANCSSPLSYPASSLSFLLNNEPVGTPAKDFIHCNQTLHGLPRIKCDDNDNRTTWTWLPLKITLEEKYLVENSPSFTLGCVGVVYNTHYRLNASKVVSLIREPKPERVTHNYSNTIHSFSYQTLMLLTFLFINRILPTPSCTDSIMF